MHGGGSSLDVSGLPLAHRFTEGLVLIDRATRELPNFLGKRFNLKAMIEYSKYTSVDEVRAEERALCSRPRWLRSKVMREDLADDHLFKILVEALIKVLNCIPQLSRFKWAILTH